MRRSLFWSYLILAATMTGCVPGRDAQLADKYQQQQLAEAADQNQVWEGNKGWLLAKLPQAVLLSQRVTAAFSAYPGAKKLRSAEYKKSDYDELFEFMRGALSGYRVQRPPESSGHLVLVDGDAAYLYDMIHLEFLGIANLDKGLFFAASEVPLERSDARSFAFVANGKADATTTWFLFRRNVLEQEAAGTQDLGTYSLTRDELDRAGVAKQVDYLTPQEREERVLAQQGLAWRHRAEMRVVQFCSSKQEARDGSKKQGGHGKHGGMGNRSALNGGAGDTPSDAGSSAGGAVSAPLKGETKLNCRTGSGNILIDNGVSAEVYSLLKNREGDLIPVISSTSREITGGTMSYSYPTDAASGNSAWDHPGKEMALELKSNDGSNMLNLDLSADRGITAASLVLPGEWSRGLRYSISGKEVTRSEFGEFFVRAYRDCAAKDSQGACKGVPELFVSLLNEGMAQDLVSYIGAHYTKPAAAGGR